MTSFCPIAAAATLSSNKQKSQLSLSPAVVDSAAADHIKALSPVVLKKNEKNLNNHSPGKLKRYEGFDQDLNKLSSARSSTKKTLSLRYTIG